MQQQSKTNLVLAINNDQFYRWIVPVAPYGAIATFVVAVVFDLGLYLDIMIGVLIGVLISEMIYFFTKNSILIYTDKIELKKGKKIIKTINYKEVEFVRYSKKNDLSLGTVEGGPLTIYLLIDLKDNIPMKLSFEPLRAKKKMKLVIKTMHAAGVKINKEGVLFMNNK